MDTDLLIRGGTVVTATDMSKADVAVSNGRIVAVADVYDALVHDRPYKQAWPQEKAVAEIESQSGKHFDPQVVEAFLKVAGSTEPGVAV